jgi:hypothetical protein
VTLGERLCREHQRLVMIRGAGRSREALHRAAQAREIEIGFGEIGCGVSS